MAIRHDGAGARRYDHRGGSRLYRGDTGDRRHAGGLEDLSSALAHFEEMLIRPALTRSCGNRAEAALARHPSPASLHEDQALRPRSVRSELCQLVSEYSQIKDQEPGLSELGAR
jgi:hypothetical protein